MYKYEYMSYLVEIRLYQYVEGSIFIKLLCTGSSPSKILGLCVQKDNTIKCDLSYLEMLFLNHEDNFAGSICYLAKEMEFSQEGPLI